MQLLRIILTITLFSLLTVLTQVGGFIYLASILTHKRTDKWARNNYLKAVFRFTSFLIFYCLAAFILVPAIAKPLGRVPLPLREKNHLQPLNILTCILSRNYVKPELQQVAFDVAKQMHDKFPGTTLNYLDANFPFVDKFPLIPHLSHNDGKKLDLAFCYIDAETSKQTNECPSFIGYGICEEPLPNEKNTADFCAGKGYWQYSFLMKIIPQKNKNNYAFDSDRTGALVNFFTSQPAIGKVFIEPHLKTRLNLKSGKVRFQGCQSVRHDDHVHIQLK